MTPLGDLLHPAYRRVGEGAETVLYLHGLGGDRTCFDFQIGAFGPRFRHLAWDMPGYGDSAPLPRMTFPALAAAAVRLLDALDIARAHIVGHSMGGMIAQEIAVDHQDRVASFVLSGTSAAFGRREGDWQRRFLADRLKPLDDGRTPADIAPRVVAALVGDGADPDGVRVAVAAMGRITPDAYRAALTCLVEFDRRDALAAITVPTLLVAGERDTAAPPKVMQRMAEVIPGSIFTCLPGAGHLASLERPQAFNGAVADFLHSLAPCDETGHDIRSHA